MLGFLVVVVSIAIVVVLLVVVVGFRVVVLLVEEGFHQTVVDSCSGFHQTVLATDDGEELELPCEAPVSKPVVIVGGEGVTGSGGFAQFCETEVLAGSSPSPLLRLRSRGKGSWQHLLRKSSKSAVQATAPPNPCDLMNFA